MTTMRPLLAIMLLLGLTSATLAGPWPRAKGETYVFIGHYAGVDGWTSLYAEHGGPRDLTFGLDIGGHVIDAAMGRSDADADGRLRVFARLPILAKISDTTAPWLFALDFGAGVDLEEGGALTPRLSLGLSAGRPISTGLGDGWTSLDIRASLGPDAEPRYSIQAVAGLKPASRVTIEIGLFAEYESSASVTIAPVIEYDLRNAGAARFGLAFADDGGQSVHIGWARRF